jgi:hypothetical protein
MAMAKLTSQINGMLLTKGENFRIAQALYNIITAKTEKTQKSYKSNYKITFESIKQLYTKFEQMITQWNILGNSCSITINHIDDSTDEFSSFERFTLYDLSKASSIEQIILKFSFLLRSDGFNEEEKYMQNYNITVRILNKVAFYNHREKEFASSFFRFMTEDNLILEIEYVDYIIARNIISTVDSWEVGLEKNNYNKMIDMIQRYSMYFPSIIRLIFFIIICVYLINNIENRSILNLIELSKFSLLSLLSIYIFMQIGYYFGRLLEKSIDGLVSTAYIMINSGDSQELKKYQSNNIHKIIGAFMSLGGSIIVAILSDKIIELINKFFG